MSQLAENCPIKQHKVTLPPSRNEFSLASTQYHYRQQRKNSLSPRDWFFCVRLHAGEPFCFLSLQWPSFLHFPRSFLHRKVGGGGSQRLSEVTTLINKLAWHTSVRRAICSHFVQCSGGTEHSHHLRLASSCCQMPARLKIANRKLKTVYVGACCMLHHASTGLGGFIYSIWQGPCRYRQSAFPSPLELCKT